MKLFTNAIFILFGLLSTSVSIGFNDRESPLSLIFSDEPFNQFLRKAELIRQPVILIADSKDCIPCKHMMDKVNRNKKLIAFLNENYMLYYHRFGSAKNWIDIERKYKLHQFPAILFLDAHGNVIAKLIGQRSPKEIYRFAKKIQKKYPEG